MCFVVSSYNLLKSQSSYKKALKSFHPVSISLLFLLLTEQLQRNAMLFFSNPDLKHNIDDRVRFFNEVSVK